MMSKVKQPVENKRLLSPPRYMQTTQAAKSKDNAQKKIDAAKKNGNTRVMKAGGSVLKDDLSDNLSPRNDNRRGRAGATDSSPTSQINRKLAAFSPDNVSVNSKYIFSQGTPRREKSIKRDYDN